MGVGPLKPPPGPSGPVPVESSLVSGVDNLSEAQSIAMSLRALGAGWMLSVDTKIREGLITKLLNLAADLAKKPAAELTSQEFNRLLSIFRTVSSVEQRQQQLEVSKAMAAIRALYPLSGTRGSGDDLPPQGGTVVNVAVGQPVGQAEVIPAWQAVQQLLRNPDVQQALKTPVVAR